MSMMINGFQTSARQKLDRILTRWWRTRSRMFESWSTILEENVSQKLLPVSSSSNCSFSCSSSCSFSSSFSCYSPCSFVVIVLVDIVDIVLVVLVVIFLAILVVIVLVVMVLVVLVVVAFKILIVFALYSISTIATKDTLSGAQSKLSQSWCQCKKTNLFYAEKNTLNGCSKSCDFF